MMLLLPKFKDLPKNSTLSEKDYLILDLKNLLRKRLEMPKNQLLKKPEQILLLTRLKLTYQLEMNTIFMKPQLLTLL